MKKKRVNRNGRKGRLFALKKASQAEYFYNGKRPWTGREGSVVNLQNSSKNEIKKSSAKFDKLIHVPTLKTEGKRKKVDLRDSTFRMPQNGGGEADTTKLHVDLIFEPSKR